MWRCCWALATMSLHRRLRGGRGNRGFVNRLWLGFLDDFLLITPWFLQVSHWCLCNFLWGILWWNHWLGRLGLRLTTCSSSCLRGHTGRGRWGWRLPTPSSLQLGVSSLRGQELNPLLVICMHTLYIIYACMHACMHGQRVTMVFKFTKLWNSRANARWFSFPAFSGGHTIWPNYYRFHPSKVTICMWSFWWICIVS